MRHRFHSICPYFAMSPETFVEKHLAVSPLRKETYWEFVQASWKGLGSLLVEQARVVVRVGGRHMRKAELCEGLLRSLTSGLDRDVRLLDDGVSSEVGNTQANAFRGARATRLVERDFCFVAQEC